MPSPKEVVNKWVDAFIWKSFITLTVKKKLYRLKNSKVQPCFQTVHHQNTSRCVDFSPVSLRCRTDFLCFLTWNGSGNAKNNILKFFLETFPKLLHFEKSRDIIQSKVNL